MPIQFPVVFGPLNKFIEQLWLQNSAKCFDAPAPNLGRPGMPFSSILPGNSLGQSLSPGLPIQPFQAVNVRQPSAMFKAPDQTAITNPAASITMVRDTTKGFSRVLGTANLNLSGVSRDSNGNILANCRVMIFRTNDKSFVLETLSDGSGNWSVSMMIGGPFFLVEYKAGSPDVGGTSVNTLVPS